MSKTVVDGKRFSKRVTTSFDENDEIPENFFDGIVPFDHELTQYIERLEHFMGGKDWFRTPTGFDYRLNTYPKDSPKWFAANIIFHYRVMTNYIKKNKISGIVEHAYRLGTLATLARTYGIESRKNSLIGKRSRKKKWVQELVRELRKSENQALPAFYTIPEHEPYFNHDGREIYRQNETVFAANRAGEVEQVTFETFRRYFRDTK